MDETEKIFGVTSNGNVGSEEAPSSVAPEALLDAVAEERNEVSVHQQTTPMTNLANKVMNWFKKNADHRRQSGVEANLDYCISAQKCEFNEEQRLKLSKIFSREVINKLFVPITSTKIRAAKAMLIDLVNQSGDPLFRIEPTPDPEVPSEIAEQAAEKTMMEIQKIFMGLQQNGVESLPPDAMAMMQQLVVTASEGMYDNIANAKEEFARNRAKRMHKKVWDTMVQGGWEKAFADFIDYICTYGTAVMLGPIPKVKATSKCIERKQNGKNTGIKNYKRVFKTVPCYEAVNPLDCYPSPDAKDVGDGALCIRIKVTADSLWAYSQNTGDDKKNGSGWMSDVVRKLLARHPDGGVKLAIDQYDYTRRMCENNGFDNTEDCTFEGVRCFASVRGSELFEMGIGKDPKGKQIEISSYYRVEVIVIDNIVVYCRIYDEASILPVSKGTFYSIPGSWWGQSIADKVAQCQTTLNNVIKALMTNMAASSNSIIYINDVQRMMNKSPDALKVKAGMTIPFISNMGANTGAPIGAVNIPSTASELLTVWKQMQTQADLDSGIPAFTEGQSSGQSGALRTASGLAIYTEASTRGMKMVMTSMDRDVIGNIARLTAEYILIYDDDMDLKGDVEVKPVGLIGKILKAQRDQQRLQLFNMVIQNPTLTQLCGIRGIVELFRPSLMDVDINPDDVLPSKQKMEEMDLINGIKQLFDATSASNGVQQNVAEQGGGAPPGVEQPPKIQGGVEERRSVA